jgi:hypothetical protein
LGGGQTPISGPAIPFSFRGYYWTDYKGYCLKR